MEPLQETLEINIEELEVPMEMTHSYHSPRPISLDQPSEMECASPTDAFNPLNIVCISYPIELEQGLNYQAQHCIHKNFFIAEYDKPREINLKFEYSESIPIGHLSISTIMGNNSIPTVNVLYKRKIEAFRGLGRY